MKKIIIFRLFLFLFLPVCGLFLFAHSTLAATIYSDYSTGNDTTGNGSSATPYKSFHKAYTTASNGDTINLTGTFSWTNADETGDIQYGGYEIAKNLTITGQNASSTIIQAATTSTAGTRRVFTIKNGYTVSLQNMKVRYGRNATDYNGREGGGILVETGGTLTVTDSHITQNYVNSTSWGGFGGGIQNLGTLTVNRTTIDNNFAQSQGGGVNNAYLAAATNVSYITNSTLAFNSTADTVATVGGAGLYIRSGTVYVTNSTIAYNDAPSGTGDTTGIDIVSGATLSIKNSIVAANEVGGSPVNASSGNWFDITNSGTLTDLGGNVFGKVNTAYSGVSFHSTSWYDLYGNGAGDNVYRLTAGTTGSLYLDTALADNSTANYTQTFAITNASSITINNGQSGSNGSVSVPGVDGRNLTRVSTVDIGAYEYDASSEDTTNPSVSLTVPENSAVISGTVALTATSTDNTAVAGITFYLDNTTRIGSEITATSSPSTYTTNWDTTAVADGSHTLIAVSRDSSNNQATTSPISITIENTTPIFSSVSASSTPTGAVITWTSNVITSSQVHFGLTTSYGTSTAESNTSPRVTSHSVTIAGLPACGSFYFQTQGKTTGLTTATSSAGTFTTLGCTSSAAIAASSFGAIATSTGGSLIDGNITLTVPTNFTATTSAATFQANKLNASTFFSVVTPPTGLSRVGTDVYNLKSFVSPTSTISSFTSPITITLAYSSSDVIGINESTLRIYRYDNSSWNALSNCSTNTTNKTVSCETSNFSDFSLFGEAAPISAMSNHGGGLPPEAYTKPKIPLEGFKLSLLHQDAKITSPWVKFSFNAGADVTGMAIANTADFTDTGIENYQETKDWNICWQSNILNTPSYCPNGRYTIYVKFYTRWGQYSDVQNITLTLNNDTGSDQTKQAITNAQIKAFTFDLLPGTRNEAVKQLQTFLAKDSSIYPEGLITGKYGKFTQKAVQKFQVKYKIAQAGESGYGIVGPATRAQLNLLIK